MSIEANGGNLPLGKNLLGAFHQPLAAVIDPTVETPLPSAIAAAEILKAGCCA